MANMPFKLSYSFEGNYRTRPEQNLSGASKKHTRDVVLSRAHEERQKRQEQRLKLRSAEILQSHIRSYLVRQRKKREERLAFDQMESTLNLHELLQKLLFIYDPSVDQNRLFRVCQKLLVENEAVLEIVETDTSFAWLIKRKSVLCMKSLLNNQMSETMLQCLECFTRNPQVLDYLIGKGYFQYLRQCLEYSPQNMLDRILMLIHRPFHIIYINSNFKQMILSHFCNNFLCSTITTRVKLYLIPFLKSQRDFPYDDIINYLNESRCFDSTNSLFYSVLALEPDEFEPTKSSIQVLSNISINIHYLKPQMPMQIDDSDDEDEIDVTPEQIIMEDYINIMNNAERVKKILVFFNENKDNEEILISLTQLCHNLLLVYKDSIRKYMLLYMLALKGTFLNRLWKFIKKHESIVLQSTSAYLNYWRDIHRAVAVFCDMFTFYTETLTDSESTDTSETFSKLELASMSELLKNVALYLIDMAFPMCRSSALPATPEMLHLYQSCLNSVKMLYTLDLRKNFCSLEFWTRKKIHISQDLSRKNYLSKTIKPFYGIISENEDEHLPPLSTIEQRSLAVLQQLPFLIEFNTRVLLLRYLCLFSMGETEGMRFHREFVADNAIVIRRTHLYEDAFEKLSLENESDLKQRLRILFINNVGLEEAGIDGGGIFKEFINEVLKTAFDPNRGFFLLTADNMLYPNPNVHLIMENYTEHYYFIGRLIGKAIFENILVDLPLAEFFLAKILVDRASAHYLKSLDPVLYRNLLYLRDYFGDVQDLGLDFTIVNNDLGETRVVDLKPNGRNIPVTNYNRLEYIHLLADLKLNTQIKKQCAAFREGLDSVVPLLWLKLFSHNELQVIIGGDTQEIDLDDLRTHTVYGGDFTAVHPTIVLFWKILQSFTETQKKQLLKFVTSCPRPPLLGFKELIPSFCIHSSGNDDRMPTASTCLNLLKIPIIKDEEVLRHKLLSAIEQQAGFELS